MDEVKPQFNPDTNYHWDVDTEFPISGKAFEILFNYLQAKVNTQEVQESLILFDAYKKMHEVFIKAVEEGKAIPTEKQEEKNVE